MKNISLKFKTLFVVLIFLSLTNCASVSLDQMREETKNFKLPKLPDKDSAIVYVVRPSNVGTIVRFNVFLDSKDDFSEMGYNRGGQYIYFKVKPGKHEIFSKAENWAKISIDAKANNSYFIKQVPELGFIMARNSLKVIDEDSGKYYVKESNFGAIKRFE